MNIYIDPTKPVFCRNCGCVLEPDEVDSEVNGKPSGICVDCHRVLYDYWFINEYDEFDEDEYDRPFNCEICGGEIGPGYSMCTCEEE